MLKRLASGSDICPIVLYFSLCLCLAACKGYGRFWDVNADASLSQSSPSAVYGKGTDGALTVTSAGLTVNKYTHITDASVFSGATIFNVADGSQLAVGDEILVIQMQGPTVANFRQETVFIGSISVNQIQATTALANSYTSGAFNAAASNVTQVMKIPQYTTVNVTSGNSLVPKVWDGQSGGIVFLRVTDTVIVDGTIDAKGYGFRGGNGTGTSWASGNASPGESWSGKVTGTNSSTAANNGGGGAGIVTGAPSGCTPPNTGWASSGSGAYAASGSNATTFAVNGIVGMGGAPYGSAALSTYYLGSAGGGNSADNCGCFSIAPGGGAGGGVIVIFAGKSITTSGTGQISVAGGDGGADGNCGYGNSGGGSGGSLYLVSPAINNSGQILATGGTQVVGSVGRIRLDYNSLTGTTNPAPGFTAAAP